MYTESTYTGIALITPMNALTFCDVLYQISSSDEPDAMYTFATGMQLVYIVLRHVCPSVRLDVPLFLRNRNHVSLYI